MMNPDAPPSSPPKITLRLPYPTGAVIIGWLLVATLFVVSVIPGDDWLTIPLALVLGAIIAVCGVVALARNAEVQGAILLLVLLIGFPSFLLFFEPARLSPEWSLFGQPLEKCFQADE